jgi:hypothetical protein
MSLIARFVFDKGDPVDVRLQHNQKDEFLKDIRDGNFFHDKEGDGVFYANLEHARFFYISKEAPAPVEEPKIITDEQVDEN